MARSPEHTKSAVLRAQVWRSIYLRATILLSSVPTSRALDSSLGMEPHGSVSHFKVHILPDHTPASHWLGYLLLAQFKP